MGAARRGAFLVAALVYSLDARVAGTHVPVIVVLGTLLSSAVRGLQAGQRMLKPLRAPSAAYLRCEAARRPLVARCCRGVLLVAAFGPPAKRSAFAHGLRASFAAGVGSRCGVARPFRVLGAVALGPPHSAPHGDRCARVLRTLGTGDTLDRPRETRWRFRSRHTGQTLVRSRLHPSYHLGVP
jgi:hypothetical protein